VQESLANNAQMHANHAGRVMLEVVVPLMEFHQSAEERRKQLMAQERKYRYVISLSFHGHYHQPSYHCDLMCLVYI
jgi:hypothetical protein